jgi:hypothetical protein
MYKSVPIDFSQSQPNGHESHNALDIISYTCVYVLFRSRVPLVHFFAPAVVFPPVASYGHQVRLMDLVTYFRIRTSLDFLVKLFALVSYSIPIGSHVPQRLSK